MKNLYEAKRDTVLRRPVGGPPAPSAATQTAAVPQGAVAALKQNPFLRDQFEAKYGPGSAARVLGQ
jgi:hypothetical protein